MTDLNTSVTSSKFSPRSIKVTGSPIKNDPSQRVDHDEIDFDLLDRDLSNVKNEKSRDIDSEIENQQMEDSDPDVFDMGPNRARFAIDNYTDLKKVHKILEESEQIHGRCKKKINLYDIHLLETNAIIKTLEQCYNVIRIKNVHWQYKDTNFDDNYHRGLEQMMKNGIEETKKVQHEFGSYKGIFIAMFDPIINKNMLNMKSQHLERQTKRAFKVANKIDQLKEMISQNSIVVKEIKIKYDEYTNVVIMNRIDDTKDLVGETQELIQAICLQRDKMLKRLNEVESELDQANPFSREDKKKILDLKKTIDEAKKMLDEAGQIIKNELQNIEILPGKDRADELASDLDKNDLISMIVTNSEKVPAIYKNLQDWKDLKERLKFLKEENLNSLELQLESIFEEAKHCYGDIQSALDEAYTDLMEKIKVTAKTIEVDIGEQDDRLTQFEKQNLADESSQLFLTEGQGISLQDLLYIHNEVAMIKSSIETSLEQKQIFLDESLAIDNKPDNDHITNEDLDVLKENYRSLVQQQARDSSRIQKKIDDLEGLYTKIHQQQINEENKKNQNLISDLKQQFSDLQQEINTLNGKVKDVKHQVDNVEMDKFCKDIEMDNELQNLIFDKLEECDKNINADVGMASLAPTNWQGTSTAHSDAMMLRPRSNSKMRSPRNNPAKSPGLQRPSPRSNGRLNQANDRTPQGSDENEAEKENKLLSLQARKKEIIENMQSLVNHFNENNNKIKELNKLGPLSIDQIKEIKDSNEALRNEGKLISEKVSQGKQVAGTINENLDSILTNVIPSIIEKYTQKNQTIDECDEQHDNLKAKLIQQTEDLSLQIEKVDDVIANLNKLNPTTMKSRQSYTGAKLEEILGLQAKLDEATMLKNALVDKQNAKNQKMAELDDLIGILDEVEQRNVSEDEISNILNRIKGINEEVDAIDFSSQKRVSELDNFEKGAKNLLEEKQKSQIDDISYALNNLDDAFQELDDSKTDTLQKLEDLQELIQQVKKLPNINPMIQTQIDQMEEEANKLLQEVKKIELKEVELKDLRDIASKKLQQLQSGTQMTPNEIANLKNEIQNLNAGVEGFILRDCEINGDAEEAVEKVKNIISSVKELAINCKKIKELQDELNEEMDGFRVVLDEIPTKIDFILRACEEMKLGSEPDDSADYWEERPLINKSIEGLKKLKAQIPEFEKIYKEKFDQIKQIKANIKFNPSDIQFTGKASEDLNQIMDDLEPILHRIYDFKDVFHEIQSELKEYQIPVNIAMRKNEIKQIKNLFEDMSQEWADVEKADQDFTGDENTEKKIRQMSDVVIKDLQEFQKEYKNLDQKQRKVFEKYTMEDILGPDNYKIIKDVRDFKQEIENTTIGLKSLSQQMSDIANMIVQQDLQNAQSLLKKKANKLRERLSKAKDLLNKITNAGDELDGNTSNNEEDEFIDALKDEMPQVFENIDKNLKQLDEIDKLMLKVDQTQDAADQKQLLLDIDGVSANISQTETLVNKLENEIIEWDAPNKLNRRDEELDDIKISVTDAIMEIEKDRKTMEDHQSKLKDKMKTAPSEKVQFGLEAVNEYLKALDANYGNYKKLQADYKQTQDSFDGDVPQLVFDQREKRKLANEVNQSIDMQSKSKTAKNASGGAFKFKQNQDKPSNMYYCITQSCKYKQKLQQMLDESKNLQFVRTNILELRGQVLEMISAATEVVKYKFIKGDEIDALFGAAMMRNGCKVIVTRMTIGKYMFGQRQILAKIINSKLVIRVGGGYMSVDEFIEQYGKIEMLKMLKSDNATAKQGATQFSAKAIGIMDVKQMLKQTINAVATDINRQSVMMHGQDGNKRISGAQLREGFNNFQLRKSGNGAPGFELLEKSPTNNFDHLPQNTPKQSRSAVKSRPTDNLSVQKSANSKMYSASPNARGETKTPTGFQGQIPRIRVDSALSLRSDEDPQNLNLSIPQFSEPIGRKAPPVSPSKSKLKPTTPNKGASKKKVQIEMPKLF